MPTRAVVDRPADALLVDRAELVTGWVAPLAADGTLTATCGGRDVVVRKCWHPDARWVDGAVGFWTILLVQELLAEARHGHVVLELREDGVVLAAVPLRITPIAADLARAYPLNTTTYALPPPPTRSATPHTLVFPGLGGVGGASLNLLVRRTMLAHGWSVPVHFESNHAELWSTARRAWPGPPRWIDGHACWGAADALGVTSARVTILRDPATRLLSIYNYNRLVHPYAFPFRDVEAFLASDAAIASTQAVQLLRVSGLAVDARAPADELAARAQDELRRSYALVGITELFEETIFLLCELAGYDAIGMWWKVLAAPDRPDPCVLSTACRRRLDELVAADRIVYDASRQELERVVAARALGAPLARYKADAAANHEVPETSKLVECLRWRQVLTDAELRAQRGAGEESA